MDERNGFWRWRGLLWLAAGGFCGFGCTAFNLGDRISESRTSYVDHTGVLRQRGEAPLLRTQDDRIEVYYPQAYSEKPILTIGGPASSVPPEEIELLEQTADHFTVRWKADSGEAFLSWRADGRPATVPGDRSQSKTTAPAGGS